MRSGGGSRTGLQESLHLPDVCVFAVQQLLGQRFYKVILFVVLMEILKTFDHALGVALDHHACNL